jgi:hypothetical protein
MGALGGGGTGGAARPGWDNTLRPRPSRPPIRIMEPATPVLCKINPGTGWEEGAGPGLTGLLDDVSRPCI